MVTFKWFTFHQREALSFRLNQTYLKVLFVLRSRDKENTCVSCSLCQVNYEPETVTQEFVVLTENLEVQGHVWRQSIWWGGYTTENNCLGMAGSATFIVRPIPLIGLCGSLYVPPHPPFPPPPLPWPMYHMHVCLRLATIRRTPVLLPFPVIQIVPRSYISTPYSTTYFSSTPARFLTQHDHFPYISTHLLFPRRTCTTPPASWREHSLWRNSRMGHAFSARYSPFNTIQITAKLISTQALQPIPRLHTPAPLHPIVLSHHPLIHASLVHTIPFLLPTHPRFVTMTASRPQPIPLLLRAAHPCSHPC